MPLAPKTRIGPYEITDAVGVGGMGEVYRAVDTRLGRTVALKVLPATVASDARRLERFAVEARAVAELSHPNILGIFDFGRDGQVAYAALEFIEGATLKSILAAGPVAPRKAADYARQIARGLAAAHARGVLHRDVKPDNVMVTADGQVKLLDFGLARRTDAPVGRTTSLGGLTDPGKVLGTIGYMAPEQVRGGKVDERSDIFAVGVLLYEMLVGQQLYSGDGRADALAAVLRDDPPPLPASVPGPLQRIVMRCLEKSPGERYQSASDLAFSLEALGGSSGTGVELAPAAPSDPAGVRVGWALTAGLVLAAAGVGWLARAGIGIDGAGVSAPAFTRVTYGRGTVFAGRFASGGQAIIYDAAWEGRPADVFDTALGSRDARPRDLAPAGLLAVSQVGDLAVLLRPRVPVRHLRTGQLSVATASGSLRAREEGVSAADWTPDGRDLVAARRGERGWVVDWPLGVTIYSDRKEISDLRLSPTGEYVAWLERASTENADVVVADRRGNVHVIAQAGATPGGLAWEPAGAEVWFTAAKSITLTDLEIRAVTLAGVSRAVLDVPGGIRLLDVAPDGRVLVSRPRETVELFVDTGGRASPLGWLASSSVRHVSDDGAQVLFFEDGAAGFDLFRRPTSGGPAVRIEQGLTWDQARLSPDGARVAIRQAEGVRIIPTGAGAGVVLRTAGQAAAWFSDNQRLLVWSSADRDGRPAIVSIDGAREEIVLTSLACAALPVLSEPAGRAVCRADDGSLIVGDLATDAVRRVVPSGEVGQLMALSPDGRRALSFVAGALPQRVLALDLESGLVTTARDLVVPDPTGVWRVGPIFATPDGRTVAYSLSRQLDELYVYSGVR